jgi:hypothetical protein
VLEFYEKQLPHLQPPGSRVALPDTFSFMSRSCNCGDIDVPRLPEFGLLVPDTKGWRPGSMLKYGNEVKVRELMSGE